MKHFLSLLLLSLSIGAFGQIENFQLPYNPDSEPDGFVGVSDVLALLAVFGQPFDAAPTFFNGDSSHVVVDVGVMNYVECMGACEALPGSWRVPTLKDISIHYLDLKEYEDAAEQYWVSRSLVESMQTRTAGISEDEALAFRVQSSTAPQGDEYLQSFSIFYYGHHCLCSTMERPKVEYHYIAEAPLGTSAYLDSLEVMSGQGWMIHPDVKLNGNPVLWRWSE